jgi:hypothetical protein
VILRLGFRIWRVGVATALSGERGEVVVVALAAALDLEVARERGGDAGRKRARVWFGRVGWGKPDRT